MMQRIRSRHWLWVRVAIYVAALVVLTLVSQRAPWQLLGDLFSSRERSDQTLTLAGTDLCRTLARSLTDRYQRDYPDLELELLPGGTNHALEQLLNGEADAAFLLRAPNASERALALEATGDTLQCLRIALGAVQIVGGASSVDSLRLDDLRALIRGEGPIQRLYAPDPNLGLWDALQAHLEIEAPSPTRVVFLADPGAVLESVTRDPGSVGLHWTLGETPADEVRELALARGGQAAVASSRTTIAEGSYPLVHSLFLAVLGNGPVEAKMFATHLTSGRGQRQIERAGAVPDRLVLREIRLTTGEIGDRP